MRKRTENEEGKDLECAWSSNLTLQGPLEKEEQWRVLLNDTRSTRGKLKRLLFLPYLRRKIPCGGEGLELKYRAVLLFKGTKKGAKTAHPQQV